MHSTVLCRPIQQQSYTLIHGHYKSRNPLVVFLGGGFKSLTNCYCQWTASLDGRGIEWRMEDPVNKKLGASFSLSSGMLGKPLPLQALRSCPADL